MEICFNTNGEYIQFKKGHHERWHEQIYKVGETKPRREKGLIAYRDGSVLCSCMIDHCRGLIVQHSMFNEVWDIESVERRTGSSPFTNIGYTICKKSQ
jgi:hypothetical protein